MKTILSQLLGFLLLCIFGTAAGGFLYMLYNGCASYVVGAHPDVFSIKVFIDGVLVCFPILLLFMPMFGLLSLVRHPSQNKVSGIITIALLSLSSWFFAVPVCSKFARVQNTFSIKKPDKLSTGYFRRMNGGVYYFSRINGNYVDAVRFSEDFVLDDNFEQNVKVLKRHFMIFGRDKYGFSDPLMGVNLRPPAVPSLFFSALFSIEQSAFGASTSSIKTWAFFSSLMAALVAVSALVSISSWRLASAFSVVFATLLILAANYLYLNFYFKPFTNQLEELGGFFILIRNNFQLAMNCFIAVVLCLFGGVCAIVTASRNRSGDAEKTGGGDE